MAWRGASCMGWLGGSGSLVSRLSAGLKRGTTVTTFPFPPRIVQLQLVLLQRVRRTSGNQRLVTSLLPTPFSPKQRQQGGD